MLYSVLAAKAYARNLQYRGAHMLHNAASAMFGFMYACIWAGIGESRSLGEYGTDGMVGYIAFTQASLWVTGFITQGLGLPGSVRTGQIALDLMRPVHLFPHLVSKEWGQIAYQFFYKSIPIYTLYVLVFQLNLPSLWPGGVLTFLALGCAAYLSICMNYIIGASAMWTTESQWLYWANHAVMMLLAGFFIPVEWLPDWLQALAWLSPYPHLLYVPTRIYLGYEQAGLLLGSVSWCVAMTFLCLAVTRLLRRKVEVQGG
ncbi:ABC transporter permease [Paenibacillus turpanensis]|uniref:ABC transporter permease n=1 Tax=Paenibacillus turpanensis TaxID=2689078 RepID=UPI00140E2FE0|nr:ABC-2 family transporter protein [Paenibacillus turpanensis]